MTASWFLTNEESSQASRFRPRVFCFPHAGGNPREFLCWQPDLEEIAEIVAMAMPGRGALAGQAPAAGISDLADRAAELISGSGTEPFLLFGHSLGAVVALEVARRLGSSSNLLGLVASGCSAPALLPSARVVRAARLRGHEFADEVAFFGGLPTELTADDDLMELLLSAVKADFRLVAEYQYRPNRPLSVPISLINGREDPHVSSEALQAWVDETVHVPEVHWSAGGHFYFTDHPAAVTGVLRDLLTRAATCETRSAEHVEII